MRSCKTPPDSHFGNRLKLRSFRARPRFMASATPPGGCAWARSAARPLTRRHRWARERRSSESTSSSDCSDARVGPAERAFPFHRRARPTRSMRRASAPLLMGSERSRAGRVQEGPPENEGGMACTVRGFSRRIVARTLRFAPERALTFESTLPPGQSKGGPPDRGRAAPL